jgi:hypothetical protein
MHVIIPLNMQYKSFLWQKNKFDVLIPWYITYISFWRFVLDSSYNFCSLSWKCFVSNIYWSSISPYQSSMILHVIVQKTTNWVLHCCYPQGLLIILIFNREDIYFSIEMDIYLKLSSRLLVLAILLFLRT